LTGFRKNLLKNVANKTAQAIPSPYGFRFAPAFA
jgi:hypothetical protein